MPSSLSNVFRFLLARVEEPSTWAGAGIVATIVHSIAPGALGDGVLALGAAIGGLLAVLVPEKSL
jgi:hypothetical protein